MKYASDRYSIIRPDSCMARTQRLVFPADHPLALIRHDGCIYAPMTTLLGFFKTDAAAHAAMIRDRGWDYEPNNGPGQGIDYDDYNNVDYPPDDVRSWDATASRFPANRR